MKTVSFERRQLTTSMQSNPSAEGRGPTQSMASASRGAEGIGRGRATPAPLVVECLARWQEAHESTNATTSLAREGQNKSRAAAAYVRAAPKCPAEGSE